MRRFFSLALFFAVSSVSAQSSEVITITPDTVIATINGKKFTAGDLERLTKHLTGPVRQMAGTDPKAFLDQYAWSEKLTSEAERLKVEQTSPWKERLEDSRRQILVQGLIQRKRDEVKIPEAEVLKYFEENKGTFRQATAKVIFLSRASYATNLADGSAAKPPDPEEVKLKAETAAKQVREGGDFAALAKEFSDDKSTADKGADLPYVVRSTSNLIPPAMRDAILQAKTGDLLGPLEHETGFYVFKVMSATVPTLEEVKADIERDLREAVLSKWMNELKAKASAVLDHEAFWSTFVAANKKALGEAK